MTTSSKVATGGTGRPNQVADADSEPTLLAYRRPDGQNAEREEPRVSASRLPAVILRIPQHHAELPGSRVRKPLSADLKNKLFWGFGIAGVLLIAVLLLTGKKPQQRDEAPAFDPNVPRQAPGAVGPIAPLPGGQPLNMQPVPTYKEDNPRALPGRMTPLAEPATLPPAGPSVPAPVTVSPEAEASGPFGVPVTAPPGSAPPAPRPSEQFMGQPPQHFMPWRNDAAPPADQGPQLSPADPRQGVNQPNRNPFTLPENDPRMGLPPGANQSSREMPYPNQPGGPVYRTADRSGQSGASFEGTIVKPNSEGQYDRTRSRPY